MKRLAILAAIAALSACSNSAEAPEVAEATAPASIAADGKPSAGKYKVTDPDGKTVLEKVNEDGSYDITDGSRLVESGTWNQKSPSVYCYTANAKDAVEVCNDEKVENGVWTSKAPDGKVYKVERVES